MTTLPPVIEEKVRRVRTAAGVLKYGQPIGSIIVDDGPRFVSRPAQRLALSEDAILSEAEEPTPRRSRSGPKLVRRESEYAGWSKWSLGRENYYIGKDEDGLWVATDSNDTVLVEDETAGGVKIGLDKHLGVHKEVAVSPKTAHLVKATEEDRAAFKEVYGKPIPPGWHDVRITNDPTKDMIASGVVGTGKRVYMYTSEFHGTTAADKWARTRALSKDIRKLDVALEADALLNDTAAAVLLMRKTGIRVGSSKEQKGSVPAFGATTLQGRHFRLNENSVTLDFVGKEGVKQHFLIKDPALVAVFRARAHIQRTTPVFETSDSKTIAYIREKTGGDYKNHDMRTFLANEMAASLTRKWERRPPKNKTEFRRMRLEVAKVVSAQLGNKPQQAIESYINPAIFMKHADEEWF